MIRSVITNEGVFSLQASNVINDFNDGFIGCFFLEYQIVFSNHDV
jgi:hypothetical protein